jgi:K+-sensing histidine kinase KdpD
MHSALKSGLGIAACTGLAAFLSILLNDGGEIKLAAPVLCLLVVILTSYYWGRLSGLIGSLAATLTLALMLFPPLGSLRVQEPTARMVLILSQLCAIGVVLISSHRSDHDLTSKCQPPRPASIAPIHQFLHQRDSK